MPKPGEHKTVQTRIPLTQKSALRWVQPKDQKSSTNGPFELKVRPRETRLCQLIIPVLR